MDANEKYQMTPPDWKGDIGISFPRVGGVTKGQWVQVSSPHTPSETCSVNVGKPLVERAPDGTVTGGEKFKNVLVLNRESALDLAIVLEHFAKTGTVADYPATPAPAQD